MQQFLTLVRSLKRNMQRKAIALLVILAFVQLKALAQPATSILISPASSVVTLGQSFTVNVRVDVATTGSVNAVEIRLNFNTTMLQVTNITKPSSALFTTETIPLPADYTGINGSGSIVYAAGIPAGSTSADFNILAITFNTIQAGTTPLTFDITAPGVTRAVLGATVVAGPPVNAPVNGSVNITTCTVPTATISNTLTCNGQQFSLNLASATGVSPFDLVINGTTYDDVTVGSEITTFTPPTNSIWSGAAPSSNDEVDASVTLGMKFQSSVAGFVKGVRFFTHSTPSGTYRANLWATTGPNAGNSIASATFSSVTGDSWNQVLFPAPVQIQANTTYIVSYHTASGAYTSTGNGLAGSVTNGPLTALASNGGPWGPNGVYSYGANPTFPSNTFGNTNYWVDLLFTPATFTFNLTSITDGSGCNITGSPIQALNVVSADCGTLPVTLLGLSAAPKNNNSVLLSWTTATEIDNRGFEIQRSQPNGSWEGIGYVNGAGNSNNLINYTYTDKNLFPQVYNYRLKQEDIDGKYRYSMVVSVTLNGTAEYKLGQNYPNPFRDETTIQYTLPAREKVTLTIFDMNGRVSKVLINGVSRDKGTHAVNFFSNTLPAGMYYYRIEAGSFIQTRKMVIR
jgi:hypothetical protein